MLAETDLPKGAFSILPCRIEDADPFVEDERLKLLSFTGGQIGWELKARAGRKKVVLELGGNAACIVDADQKPRLDLVVGRLISGSFYQSGQSCIGVQRILVHASLYDEVKKKLRRGHEKTQGRRSQGSGNLPRPDDRRSGRATRCKAG